MRMLWPIRATVIGERILDLIEECGSRVRRKVRCYIKPTRQRWFRRYSNRWLVGLVSISALERQNPMAHSNVVWQRIF